MKTPIKIVILSFLSLMCLSLTWEPGPVFGTIDFNSEEWKNEGIFTPLTPFKSFNWPEDTYTDFENQFTLWANGMEQSYYHIMDAEEILFENESNDADIKIEDHTFRGFQFRDILKNAFVDGYKVGFTYQNRDYRSDYDRNRYDVFSIYGSNVPKQKHLYIFSIDMETKKPIVFYLDGDTMFEGEKFEIKETGNEELKMMFHELMMDEGNSNTISTEVNSSYITDWNVFSQLSQGERNDYCTITPWYEIPNGWCSDKGTMPDEHWYAALEYGKQTGADIDTAIQETYDPSFYENRYALPMPNFETSETIEGRHQNTQNSALNVWGPNLYIDFLTIAFDEWAINLGQSYESLSDYWSVYFNGYDAQTILSNATFNGESTSFFYDLGDTADFSASYVFDVAGILKSTHPDDEHLYIFTRDRKYVPRVLYLSGEDARRGIFNLSQSQNSELNTLWQQFTPGPGN